MTTSPHLRSRLVQHLHLIPWSDSLSISGFIADAVVRLPAIRQVWARQDRTIQHLGHVSQSSGQPIASFWIRDSEQGNGSFRNNLAASSEESGCERFETSHHPCHVHLEIVCGCSAETVHITSSYLWCRCLRAHEEAAMSRGEVVSQLKSHIGQRQAHTNRSRV